MKKTIVISLLLTALRLTAGEIHSEKINTIALFKNGSGFFMSSFEIPAGADSFEMMPLVTPAHGTFWVSRSQGRQIISLVSQEKDIDKKITAVTTLELLKANVGSRVKLAVRDEYIMGKLIGFEEKQTERNFAPYRPGKAVFPPDFKTQIVMLETDSGICALDAAQINGVTFLTDKINRDTVESEKRVVVSGKLEPAEQNTSLYMSYVGKGITWAPSYIVDITDNENVTISAKCIIINEAADIENTKILLITGFPQLEFADINSPLAMTGSLADFLAGLDSGQTAGYGRGVTSNVTTQRMMVMEAKAADSFAPISYGAAAEGQQLEDMFFYPIENVTLAKDQTGYYPLFSQKVDCKHVYKWDIANNIDTYYRYSQQPQQKEETVWHCIKLNNNMNQPWTTAPVETIKDNLILGQSTLDYTLPNDEAVIKITRAGAIKANQAEYVSQRVPNATSFFGVNYDQVTVEGSLYITNTKDIAIDIEVSKTITGKTVTTSPKAEIKKTITNVGQVNENERLEWKVNVPAGEKTELKYSYKAYLRQ